MTDDGTFLENDARNPCVGCGPGNPVGLRLQFRRRGDAVHARLAATELHQGWPGRLHSGILYLAMLETANWTLYGLAGRVGLPTRTSALGLQRWVRVGETLTLTGRRDAENVVRVEATDAEGRPVATLERAYDLVDRATFLRRMGYDEVPAGLEEALPE